MRGEEMLALELLKIKVANNSESVDGETLAENFKYFLEKVKSIESENLKIDEAMFELSKYKNFANALVKELKDNSSNFITKKDLTTMLERNGLFLGGDNNE